MRLLDTRTGKFHWVEDPRHVRYAILSHVWATKDDPNAAPEQTYQDICKIQQAAGDAESVLPEFPEKIRRFCQAALKDGFEFGWADTCCIDKSSSSELSEAINSMYSWYRYAGTCYAYLHDVNGAGSVEERTEQFKGSRWFTRGWTLQELIAPNVLLFMSKEWEIIGSKHTVASLVESVTGIERTVLTFEQPLEVVSVARRMSWAASRVTSREEDEAYSLMGIFGVNMPTTYGEGRYAFTRLQEEILKHIPDQTIFAWGRILQHHTFTFSNPSSTLVEAARDRSPLTIGEYSKQYLLASSPRDFKSSGHLFHIPRKAFAKRLGISAEDAYQVFTPTPYGIHTRIPLVTVTPRDAHTNVPTHLAILACEDVQGRLLALLLRPQSQTSGIEYSVGTIVGRVGDLVGSDEPFSISTLWSHYSRATYLSLKQVDFCFSRDLFEMADVYIAYHPSQAVSSLERDAAIHAVLRDSKDAFEVRVAGWSRKLLSMQGYHVHQGTDSDSAFHNRVLSRPLSSLVVSSGTEYIIIQVGRCNCEFGERFGLLSVLVSSRHARHVLADRFADELHLLNHPAHIHSWAFRSGTASKEIELESQMGERLTLRLTFTHETADSESTRVRTYRLGIEIWNSNDTVSTDGNGEVVAGWWDEPDRTYRPWRAPQYPTSGLPYSTPQSESHPAPLQRTRSNSLPYTPQPPPFLLPDGLPQVPIHTARERRGLPTGAGVGFIPSPPLSSSESSGRNMGSAYDVEMMQQRQSPRSEQHRDARAFQTRPQSLERSPYPHGMQRGARHMSAWVPPSRMPTGWDSDGHQLKRPRSLEDEIGTPQRERLSWDETGWKDDMFVRSEVRISGQRHVQLPARGARSDDEGDYYAASKRVADGRRVRTADARHMSDWLEPEHSSDSSRSQMSVYMARSTSPVPMTESEPEEFKRGRRAQAADPLSRAGRAHGQARVAAIKGGATGKDYGAQNSVGYSRRHPVHNGDQLRMAGEKTGSTAVGPRPVEELPRKRGTGDSRHSEGRKDPRSTSRQPQDLQGAFAYRSEVPALIAASAGTDSADKASVQHSPPPLRTIVNDASSVPDRNVVAESAGSESGKNDQNVPDLPAVTNQAPAMHKANVPERRVQETLPASPSAPSGGNTPKKNEKKRLSRLGRFFNGIGKKNG